MAVAVGGAAAPPGPAAAAGTDVADVDGGAVAAAGGVRVRGLPYGSRGGVAIGPKGAPRNWVIVAAAAAGSTTSTELP